MKDLEIPHVSSLDVNNSQLFVIQYCNDLLQALSYVLDLNITKKLKSSAYVTIMTDESTYIVIHHKLCISARIVDPTSLKVSKLIGRVGVYYCK